MPQPARPLIAALAALAALAAVSGCGGADAPSAEQQVRAAFGDYTQAFARGDETRACALLTPSARRATVRGGADYGLRTCEAALRQGRAALSPQQLEQVRRVTVRSVAISGDTATVRLRTALDGQQTVTRLQRVDGDWRVAANR